VRIDRGWTAVIEVKICGINDHDALEVAIEAGADWVGLVHFPRSPRHVALPVAESLARAARGRVRIVALVVDADDALIAEIVAKLRPDLLQLHGSESPSRVAAIRARHAIPVMKAIKVETAADAEGALAYAGSADLVLFDAKPPKDAVLPGGNGVPFDWRALEGVRGRVVSMLSGGLTPDNVAAAIAATGAERVDVSSGVERAPGVKDPARIRAFLRAAKGDSGRA
jgi:phosphoribosylanthranilate isomerase